MTCCSRYEIGWRWCFFFCFVFFLSYMFFSLPSHRTVGHECNLADWAVKPEINSKFRYISWKCLTIGGLLRKNFTAFKDENEQSLVYMYIRFRYGVAILRGAGCGVRAAGHFLCSLPDFDFGTSSICSFIVLTYYHSCWLSMSITVCTDAHSFCSTCTCILFPVPMNCSCSSNYNSNEWYFSRQAAFSFCFQWCWDKLNLN